MVARAMKDEAEEEIENLDKNPDSIFKFVKSMQKNNKDVDCGRYISNERGRLVCQQWIEKGLRKNLKGMSNDWKTSVVIPI